MSFLGEIKRRKVFQVAAVYLVVAWLIMQVVDVVAEPLNLPGLFATMVIVLLAIGLPIALIFAWVFDVTPEGLVRDTGQSLPKGRRIDYVLFGVLIVAVGWILYRVEFDQPESVSDTAPYTETAAEKVTAETSSAIIPNSIAVLPFENLSLDPEDAFFAAGIHESTLNQLAKIHDLAVMSRSSVMQYTENRPPIREIARELSVETVMEGSVRYAQGRVLIAAQLIDGRTDTHLWSEEFNRELTDVFAVQAEVAKQIANALQVELLPEDRARIERRATNSAEAYEHYLYALSLPFFLLFPEYWTPYSESLEQAIAADPNFAEAYSALSYGYYMRGDRDQAVEYAKQAIQLDPKAGRAHWIIGMTAAQYFSRREEARERWMRSIEYSTNDPFSLLESGRMLAEDSGHYTEAIRLAKRAVLMDQRDALLRNLYGLTMIRAGELAEAEASLREGIKLDPGNYLQYLNLATVAYLQRDHDLAKETLKRAREIASSGASFRVGYMAYLYGLLGEPQQAEELLARQLQLRTGAERENWRPLGWAVLGTRDKQRALSEWTMTINGYVEDSQPVSIGRITRFRDNWLDDPMLEEPEFVELRRRVGYEG